ncbi:two-component regulator propeller domain-containing protein [Allomuricauda taeanensis]|uniref:ligand-binding sensor domain-containing protein n=1 Tax=Flagellimonas taeanensis TaxID=1005926 RepID=UPI002E7B73C7|nr:two-component regulator propeller domain-containing protein [Allomuricauda taeanensis]MEE1963131.1 two-component regulator propeller domain-containing protein [Allomuricauda taeanensis]
MRLLFILFWVSLSVFGQTPHIFNKFTTAQGLATNKVNSVWQDSTGFLWIGTEAGLQRFDGRKIISYAFPEEERAVPDLGIDQLVGGDEDTLWLLQGNYVGIFDTANLEYHNVKIEYKNKVHPRSEYRLFKDSKGRIFLCVRMYGILWYDPIKQQFTEENLPIEVPEGWGVNYLYEDIEKGHYWISSNEGLAVYDAKSKTLSYHGRNPGGFQVFEQRKITYLGAFAIDAKGNYWFSYWDFTLPHEHSTLMHFDVQTNRLTDKYDELDLSPTHYMVLGGILETKQGDIWIGGENILIHKEPNEQDLHILLKRDASPFSIKANIIEDLFEDREGNVWFSTDNGLYMLNVQQQHVYNQQLFEDYEGSNNVTSLLESSEGDIWVGVWGKGIMVYDEQLKPWSKLLNEEVKHKFLGVYHKVWDLYEPPGSKQIWSACQGGSIAIFDARSGDVVKRIAPKVFKMETVRQLEGDPDGNIWFATQRGQLVKWNKGSPIAEEEFKLVDDFETIIYKLYFDKQGRLWITVHNKGIYVMDPKTHRILYHFDDIFTDRFGYKYNVILDIEQYNDSIFFLGGEVLKILNINTEKVTRKSRWDGLSGTHVSRMSLDDEGILWMVTNNGLNNYNPERNSSSSYGERDGILYGDKAWGAKLKRRNGEICFAGENGLFGFDPSEFKKTQLVPEVTITDFKLLNRYIPVDSIMADGKMTLKHYENSFAFYFSSLRFHQQNKLDYYYQIPGINKDWVKAEYELVANYTTMPPGDYDFMVKCVNVQGVESDTIKTIHFEILPPFYKTWWFTSMIILLCLALGWFMYRLQINKLLAVHQLRNKVARDLHDDMGSTLSTINILSSMAKSRMQTDPVRTSDYLGKITDNSQRMMEAMDDIVWSIKPDNDNMQKISARMREYANGTLESKDVEIKFEIQDKVYDLKLDMESRRDLFLIFKEAINNVAKYSKASLTNIKLSYGNGLLQMEICDNGTGFEMEQSDKGNGLGNMEKRAFNLNGQLHITSELGKGTRILLKMPI